MSEILKMKETVDWRCLHCKRLNTSPVKEAQEKRQKCSTCGSEHELVLHISVLGRRLIKQAGFECDTH
jgi:DNA-directed RNA polymerase subunit RPC12/RpoP